MVAQGQASGPGASTDIDLQPAVPHLVRVPLCKQAAQSPLSTEMVVERQCRRDSDKWEPEWETRGRRKRRFLNRAMEKKSREPQRPRLWRKGKAFIYRRGENSEEALGGRDWNGDGGGMGDQKETETSEPSPGPRLSLPTGSQPLSLLSTSLCFFPIFFSSS